MQASITHGLLVLSLEAGEAFLAVRDDAVSCLGPWPTVDRKAFPKGSCRRSGLQPLRATAETVLGLTAAGGHVSRLAVEPGGGWQVDSSAILAASGTLEFLGGRRGFYPRRLGPLVAVRGTGELWLATGRTPAMRLVVRPGQENRFDARTVLAFSEGMDSRVRRTGLDAASVTFTPLAPDGEGSPDGAPGTVYVAAGRA